MFSNQEKFFNHHPNFYNHHQNKMWDHQLHMEILFNRNSEKIGRKKNENIFFYFSKRNSNFSEINIRN